MTERGTATTTKTSTDHDIYCFKCKERGHAKRNCPKFKPRTKPDGAAKWSSVYRTTSHSDEEYYSQGATRPNKKASVSLVCESCAHCSPGTNKSTADTTVAAKDNESPDREKLVINFAGSNNDFDGGFMFTAAATRRFTPSTKGATLLVDSGASESFLDDELIPRLKGRMREFNFQRRKRSQPPGNTQCMESAPASSLSPSATATVPNSRSTSARWQYQAWDATSSPQLPS